MIIIKNLYGDTTITQSVITVSSPQIIDISDIDNESDDSTIFAEKMYQNNDANQQAMQQMSKKKPYTQEHVTAESYRKSLEYGLTEQDKQLLKDYYEALADNSLEVD